MVIMRVGSNDSHSTGHRFKQQPVYSIRTDYRLGCKFDVEAMCCGHCVRWQGHVFMVVPAKAIEDICEMSMDGENVTG